MRRAAQLGRRGLAELVERNCAHAAALRQRARSAGGVEIPNQVVLNQVLVSFGSDEATERVIAAIQADGTCWCSGTRWNGRVAMRISVLELGDHGRRRRAICAGGFG